MQVAAWDWDGCLQAMPFSDCQAQQAEEQDSWCHGHLKRSGWEGKSLQLCLSPRKPGFWVFRLVRCAWVALLILSALGGNVWGACFLASATLEGSEQPLVCMPSFYALSPGMSLMAGVHTNPGHFGLQGPGPAPLPP